MPDLKAIIFDLDGTLLDTIEDLAFSVNAVLEKYALKEHPVDDYRFFVGDGIDVLVQRAFPADFIGKNGLTKIIDEVKEEYSRRWNDHTKPYDGIVELLEFLERNNIPKGIFSNKLHEFAILTVTELLPDWTFIDIIGIKTGTPRKPNPLGALKIAEKMQIDPSQIIYLGDTDIDMTTAKNGGFYPVGALWGFRPSDELKEAGAEVLAEHPSVVSALFK
ncbi:MAG: HAD family hydrolase [Bacillota bacterium]|nr:HAD family hydrolase [Bacillota bacterium]